MPARLVSDNGKHVVIRPLVYAGEDEARLYAKQCELPVIGCCCPACGDLSLQRQRVKRLILGLDASIPASSSRCRRRWETSCHDTCSTFA